MMKLLAACALLLVGCTPTESEVNSSPMAGKYEGSFVKDSVGKNYLCPTCEGKGYIFIRGGLISCRGPKQMKKKKCPTCNGFKMKPCCIGPSLAR